MYTIDPQFIVGRKFHTTIDPKSQYICIGYGAAKETGRLLIVGRSIEDNKDAEEVVRTFFDRDVRFLPNS
jgi:hypothetical protein